MDNEQLSSAEEGKLCDADKAWLLDTFGFAGAPAQDQGEKIFEVHASARDLAIAILAGAVSGSDRTIALRKLRECLWYAKSAIKPGGTW